MLKIRLEGFEEALRLFSPEITQKAAKYALKEAAAAGRTAAGKAIREKWNIKATKVNAELKNLGVTRVDTIQAIIQAKGRPISLTYFGAKEVKDMGGRVVIQTRTSGKSQARSRLARGVTVQILRGQPTTLKKAFIATVKSGHIGVFQRTGPMRLPIKDMSTITIASMFNQQPAQEATARVVHEKWQERFWHHLKWLTE
jgi:hypothetical protein